MPNVPIGLGAYLRESAFTPEVLCQNFYVEEDKSGISPDGILRIGRPGLTLWLNMNGSTVRGLFRQEGLFDGKTWGVLGSRFYEVATTGKIDRGGVGNGGRVAWAANYEKIFVLSAYVAFQYNGTTLDGIEMPDARDVQDIDVLNNFLILACPDGRFYWLPPGETEVDALHFATAESAPDGLVAAKVLGDELILFGRDRGEVWQPTGSLNIEEAFQRAPGRTFSRGCMSRDAVCRFDNSIIWPAENAVVYRLGNVPDRISDHGVEQRLRDRTGLPSACVVEADGHSWYVLKIPGQGSMAYDAATQQWSEWTSEDEDEWRPHCSARIEDGWLLGDQTSGRVWLLDPDAATDDGETVVRKLSGTIAVHGLAGRNDSLSIMAGGSADFTLKVRWKDGQDDYPDYFDELEVRAPMDVASMYRLGQPLQPFRTFEITIDEPVRPTIAGAKVNEAWQ